MRIKNTILFVLLVGFISCNSSESKDVTSNNLKEGNEDTIGLEIAKPILKDTLFYLKRNMDSISVEIRVPNTIKGSLLLLHGWNLPSTDFCNKTLLCQKALDSGYLLIIPNFGKSTYQWENYPQTIKRFLKYPTRKWMMDTFIVHLQSEFNLLAENDRNFVYGVSTGGRGAALLALENPKIFKAAACLSADFDQSQLIGEPINTGYYGPLEKFNERWTGRDNIHNRANEFKSGIYLGHGVIDKVCPVSQTVNFDLEVRKVNPNLKVETHIDSTGAHDYPYWDSNTDAILAFFSLF